jgi:hypothetical protein
VPDPRPFEVEINIEDLKSYKSSGSDHIPAELIQAGGETLQSEINIPINSIWSKEELLYQRNEYIVVPVHKKGKQ